MCCGGEVGIMSAKVEHHFESFSYQSKQNTVECEAEDESSVEARICPETSSNVPDHTNYEARYHPITLQEMSSET